ncbi:hypothetical protein [Halovivax asiaticus]|nr:hypothetical protein [Halovivax asiaticus]
MNALLGPVKKVLGRVVTQWLAPIFPVLVVAVFAGLLAALLAEPTGLVEYVPSISLPLVGWVLEPTTVVFIVVALLGLFVGGCFLLVRRHREEIETYWNTYSAWAQAVIVGCLVATLLAGSLLVATLFDRVPAYTVVLGFLVTWPLSAGLVLLFDRRSNGDQSSALSSVKTGYVHTRGLESRTLSLIVGFLGAMVGGLSLWSVWTWYAGTASVTITAVLTALLGIAITLVVYNRYETTTVERTDITIVAVRTPEARPIRELTIKNESSTSVDLAQSRIRDTSFELYRLGVAVTLRPGAVCTFEIPDSFTLEPNDDSIDLPLGYSLKRGGETPTLFTRSGDIFALELADDAIDGALSKPEATPEPNSSGAELVPQE